MTLLNATLSSTALAYVVGCESSQQVWETLVKHYSASSRTYNAVNLKSDLQTIAKKSGKTIDGYIQRVKELEDKLANISIVIDDEDVVIFTPNGLPTKFGTFCTSLRTRSQMVSFEELHVLLVAEEATIDKQSKRDEVINRTSALLPNTAIKNQNQSPNFSNSNFSRGRNLVEAEGDILPTIKIDLPVPQVTRGVVPQIFHQSYSLQGLQTKHNNTKLFAKFVRRLVTPHLDCYNRMNYNFQDRHPPAHLGAMVGNNNPNHVAMTAFMNSKQWLTGSGCNSHITSDFGQLTNASEYAGDEQTTVGNDQSLPITHSGQVFGPNSPSEVLVLVGFILYTLLPPLLFNHETLLLMLEPNPLH